VSVKLNGVDSVEFAVKSLKEREKQLTDWGFSKLGDGKAESVKSALWAQGKIKILLSQGEGDNNYASKFVRAHGDGICNVTLAVDDAEKTYNAVLKRGAESAHKPTKEKVGGGEITQGGIKAMGDVHHTFISRKNTSAFSSSIEVDIENYPKGYGMFAVDHLTCNVEKGQMEHWADFYQKIFDFKVTRFFKITTGRTGLLSKVLENSEGTVKIPINEPTETKSQIQEYLDVNHGPGVQHLALATGDILTTLPKLRKAGQQFLDVPDTYYDDVPKRIKGIKEDMKALQGQRILADGDNAGYLLQIFSQNAVGPFFFEVIQRCGNQGFGEGNFKALFEAIERDQERRGVL
jgi:4-hydroxyphenylpyruvate dioxygenase